MQNEKTINVRVLTTSGNYPEDGFVKVPVTQPLNEILAVAAEALSIVDTSRWVVRIKERGENEEVPPSSTYQQLGLHGQAKLDWGPSEAGGGGYASVVE